MLLVESGDLHSDSLAISKTIQLMNEFEIALLCIVGAVCVSMMVYAYFAGTPKDKE